MSSGPRFSMAVKISGGIFVGILCLLLTPFVFVGENWGMMWFFLAAPLSTVIEARTGIGSHSYFLIGATSLIIAAFWAAVVYLAARLVGHYGKKA